MSKRKEATECLGALADISEALHNIKSFVDRTDDKELSDTAKQTIDTVTLLRLRMFNRSTQGKYDK
jgi:hypothetical protein